MRLICDLCRKRNLTVLINIHDVGLAQTFAERIIGLRAGEVVFDGSADEVTAEVLTAIYGAEDWSQTIRKEVANDEDIPVEATA